MNLIEKLKALNNQLKKGNVNPNQTYECIASVISHFEKTKDNEPKSKMPQQTKTIKKSRIIGRVRNPIFDIR